MRRASIWPLADAILAAIILLTTLVICLPSLRALHARARMHAYWSLLERAVSAVDTSTLRSALVPLVARGDACKLASLAEDIADKLGRPVVIRVIDPSNGTLCVVTSHPSDSAPSEWIRVRRLVSVMGHLYVIEIRVGLCDHAR